VTPRQTPTTCPNCGHAFVPARVAPTPKVHLVSPRPTVWDAETLCGYALEPEVDWPPPLLTTPYRTRATCLACERRVRYLKSQGLPWR
jgi:hypothetical protein